MSETAKTDWNASTAKTAQTAHEYVRLHRFDDVVSKVVNRVLQERPADPFRTLTEAFAQYAQDPCHVWGTFSCDAAAEEVKGDDEGKKGKQGDGDSGGSQTCDRTCVTLTISIFNQSIADDSFVVNGAMDPACLQDIPVGDIFAQEQALSACSADTSAEIQWRLFRFATQVRDELSTLAYVQDCLRRENIRHSQISTILSANDLFAWRSSGFPMIAQKVLFAGGPSTVAPQGVAVGLGLSLWSAAYGPHAEDLHPLPEHPFILDKDWAPRPNCMEVTLLHFRKIHEKLSEKVGDLCVDGVNHLRSIAEGVALVYDVVNELFPTLPTTECPGNGDWFEVLVFCATPRELVDGAYPVNTEGKTEMVDAVLERYQNLCTDRSNIILISPFALDSNGIEAYTSLHKSHPSTCVMVDAQVAIPEDGNMSYVTTVAAGPSSFFNEYRRLFDQGLSPEMLGFDERALRFPETALGVALALPRSLRFFLLPREGADCFAHEFTRLITCAAHKTDYPYTDNLSNLPDSFSFAQMKHGLDLCGVDVPESSALFQFMDLNGSGTIKLSDFEYVDAHGNPATLEEIWTFYLAIAAKNPRIREEGASLLLGDEPPAQVTPEEWQRCARSSALSEDHIRAVFVVLDTNRSGTLCREELDGLSVLAAIHLFNQIEKVRDSMLRQYKSLQQAIRHLDVNRTNTLSAQQFRDGLQRMDGDITKETASLVFNFMDFDGSNMISKRDFEWLLEFHVSSFFKSLVDFRAFVTARYGSSRNLFIFFAGKNDVLSRSVFTQKFPLIKYPGVMDCKVLFSFLDAENCGVLREKHFVYLDLFQATQAQNITLTPPGDSVTKGTQKITRKFGTFAKAFASIVDALQEEQKQIQEKKEQE